MTTQEIIALSAAGFTKQEILSLVKIAPTQNTGTVGQPNAGSTPNNTDMVSAFKQALNEMYGQQVAQAPVQSPLIGSTLPIQPTPQTQPAQPAQPAQQSKSAADEILSILNNKLQSQARVGDVQPPQQTGVDVLASIIDPPDERQFTDSDIREFITRR